MKFFLTFFLLILPGLFLTASENQFSFDETSTAVILKENGKPVWQYNFGDIVHDWVPEKKECRTAGCYVHPIYGMNGEILTDNAPKDHYHHHGAFWTWPHVQLHEKDGSTQHFDLWLGNTPIHQYFVRWIERKIDPDRKTAVLAVENAWLIGKVVKNEQGKILSGEKVMKEIVRITTGPASTRFGFACRSIDFDFTWTPIGRDLSLRGAENKSYGGLTVRFHPPMAKDPATQIITPLGIAQDDIPETPLQWCDYTSAFSPNSDKKSGAAILIPTCHPDYPPTWMVRHYGMIAVGWPGIADKRFEQGKEIKLHYRIWIHDGVLTKNQLDNVYRDYLTK